LYQIEPESYRALSDNAKAALAKAEANLEVTRLKARRVAELRKNNAISQQDDDDAQALYAQAQAEVAACTAALAEASINLNRTSITAPISGRISKSSVTVGALVTADQPTPLCTIHQLDPIYVDMTQTAEDLVQLQRKLLSHGGGVAEAAERYPLRITLKDGTRYEFPGTLRFTDVGVNEATGTVTLRAEFPNPQHMLPPGLYVQAELTEGVDERALLVPQRSILRDNRGNPLVLVVKADGTAERRPIKTGKAYGESWILLEGLAAGDKVIVDGIQKVRPGAPVRAVPYVAPGAPEKPSAKPGS
jgi:membrane fusion protein (multidrug efflux system)